MPKKYPDPKKVKRAQEIQALEAEMAKKKDDLLAICLDAEKILNTYNGLAEVIYRQNYEIDHLQLKIRKLKLVDNTNGAILERGIDD